MKKIKFRNRTGVEFVNTLKERINTYFSENNKPQHGDWKMYTKLIFFVSLIVLAYSSIFIKNVHPALHLLSWASVGLCIAFIGFNVSHDAIHGSLSKNKTFNKILGYSFNVLGANEYMWKIMHNVVHHTYTNIPGHDEDLEPVPLIRLNPDRPLKRIHRFQHWYAFFFYSFAYLAWVLMKDFAHFFSDRVGNYQNKKHPLSEYFVLFVSKAVFLTIFLILPLVYSGYGIGLSLLGFLTLLIVAGITLAIVFQLAHVVEGTEFPEPDEDGSMENHWAIHQLITTSNFARKSLLANWFLGGLNFQVEHHLFPNICHVHYRKISDIVRNTAVEFGIPYNEHETFWSALKSHQRMLKRLGTEVNPGLRLSH